MRCLAIGIAVLTSILTACAPTGASTSASSQSGTPSPSASAGSPYFAPITGFRYALAPEGSDKTARTLMIADVAKSALTGFEIRSITYNGDDFGVTVTVFNIDPLVSTKPALQRDLVVALAGKLRTTTFGLAGRRVEFLPAGPAFTYAWVH